MRVYPSCKRIGTFSVRARRGINHIRFHGRFRGRALPAGGYRLIVHARGVPKDAAAVPIVIARGKMRPAELHRARRATVCSERVADIGFPGSDPGPPSSATDYGNAVRHVVTAIANRVKVPIMRAAGAIARKTTGVSEVLKDAAGDLFANRFVLTVVGLIALMSAILGGLVLAQVVRSIDVRDRVLH